MKVWIKGGLWGIGIDTLIIILSNLSAQIRAASPLGLFGVLGFFGGPFVLLFSILILPVLGIIIGIIIDKVKSKKSKTGGKK